MDTRAAEPERLRFGVFELELQSGELLRSGIQLHLAPQPFKVLAMLARHHRQLVTRDEIRDQIWGRETFVDFEHGLNVAIKEIRPLGGLRTGLYLLNAEAEKGPQIEFYNFATRKITPVLALERRPAYLQPSLSVTADGLTIYYTQWDSQSVIRMIEMTR